MSSKSRHGISATELVCSAIIISVIGLTLGPALVFVGRQNRTSSQHLEAQNAAGNLLDEVSSRSFDDVTQSTVSKIGLPKYLGDQLPDAKLLMGVEENNDGKRISVEITWESANGGPREREALHVWIFDSEDSA